ncbi:MAG: hypothetical protein ACTH0S_04315 [Senegalia sp. (in: firmicutes)]
MNNEEKIYDLLEKVYIELQETKKDLHDFKEESKNDLSNFRQESNQDLENFREETKDNFQSFRKEAREDLAAFREETNRRFDTLENKFDTLENKLDDLESNNASRHIVMNSNIEKIKKNMSTVEEVTAKNWTDIIELKKIK